MAKTVVIDEFHLTLRIPIDLPSSRATTVRRTLTGAGFMARLRRTPRSVLRTYSELRNVRVKVTR